MTDLSCGRYGRHAPGEMGDRAARHIMERRGNWAVCLSPEGVATVETLRAALESDIVGVYTRDDGLLALTRLIAGDLQAAIKERGIKPEMPRRRVVIGRRAA